MVQNGVFWKDSQAFLHHWFICHRWLIHKLWRKHTNNTQFYCYRFGMKNITGEANAIHIIICDNMSCTSIRQQTGVTDILFKISREMGWLRNHVARRNDNRGTIRLTEWQLREGKRRRGRQKRRWRDNLTVLHGYDMGKISQNHEGYIQHWIETA